MQRIANAHRAPFSVLMLIPLLMVATIHQARALDYEPTFSVLVDAAGAPGVEAEALQALQFGTTLALKRALAPKNAAVMTSDGVFAALEELGQPLGKCPTACQKSVFETLKSDLGVVLQLTEDKRGGLKASIQIYEAVEFRSAKSIRVQGDTMSYLLAVVQQKTGKLAVAVLQKVEAKGMKMFQRSVGSDEDMPADYVEEGEAAENADDTPSSGSETALVPSSAKPAEESGGDEGAASPEVEGD